MGAVKALVTVTCEFVAKTPPLLAIQTFTAGRALSILAWRSVPFKVTAGAEMVPVPPSSVILVAPRPSCSALAFHVICWPLSGRGITTLPACHFTEAWPESVESCASNM